MLVWKAQAKGVGEIASYIVQAGGVRQLVPPVCVLPLALCRAASMAATYAQPGGAFLCVSLCITISFMAG